MRLDPPSQLAGALRTYWAVRLACPQGDRKFYTRVFLTHSDVLSVLPNVDITHFTTLTWPPDFDGVPVKVLGPWSGLSNLLFHFPAGTHTDVARTTKCFNIRKI